MEIMGLVVIVILITIGLFFVVRFNITKQPSDLKKSYTQTEVAANILNSMLKTTAASCYGITVKDLLVDCAESSALITSTLTCENSLDSCTYLKQIIGQIFTETLIKWGNQNFDLRVYTSSGDVIHCTHEGCDSVAVGCAGEREAKQSYIPTKAGTLTINLEVC